VDETIQPGPIASEDILSIRDLIYSLYYWNCRSVPAWSKACLPNADVMGVNLTCGMGLFIFSVCVDLRGRGRSPVQEVQQKSVNISKPENWRPWTALTCHAL
jgi:hypothetical protein